MDTNSPAKARRTFFIDSENHINTCLQGIESLTERDLVVVFHRESNLSAKQKDAIKDSPARIEWILCQDSGVKNSLDVQLIAELSRRIACHEIDNGYIVSQDQGYKPALHYLLNRYSDEFRFIGLKKSIDEFMLTDALISAESRKDVHEALVHNAGQIVGTAMYRHIRDLFDKTGDEEEPAGGYSFDDAPLFPEQAEESAGQKANGNGSNGASNGSQRKTSKRRKSRAGSKPAASTPSASESGAPQETQAPEPSRQSAAHEGEAKTAQSESRETSPGSKPPRTKRVRGAVKQTANAASGEPEQSVSQPAETNAAEQASAEPKPKRQSRSSRAKSKAAGTSAEESADASREGAAATGPAAQEPPANGSKPVEDSGRRDISSLTKLPGIGKALASRLESVGIDSAGALKSKGSKATWVLLKKQNPATSINWLYALEGAVLGVSVKELDEETKTALKSFSKLTQ